MNKENCALKLVDEITLYYDAWSKKHQIYNANNIKYKMGGTCSMHREYVNGYSDLMSKREGNRPHEKSGGVKYRVSLKRSLKHSFTPV